MNLHELEHTFAGQPIGLPSRRDFLGLSVGAALALAIADSQQTHASASVQSKVATNDRSVIVLWMQGGASHIDSFDPKKDCTEAGPYGQIQTKIPGVNFTDRLPKLAGLADKLAVVRSVVGEEAEHNRARYYVNTGHRPIGNRDAPGLGSIVSQELSAVPMKRANRTGLSAFVTVGGAPFCGPGFLGTEHSGFLVIDPEQRPQNLGTLQEARDSRFQRRLNLLKQFDSTNPITAKSTVSSDRETARQQAVAMMSSPNQAAFELSTVKPAIRDAYGRHTFGQACLMARRLVEVGVRFVEVHLDGWDTHSDNFNRHDPLLAQLDSGFSSLLTDLQRQGLLEQTLVLCMGEFGRTPRINPEAGRDHHASCWSAVLAGGGIKPGIAYGATNIRGSFVTKDPVRVPDLLATIFNAIGIDPNKQYTDRNGKPVSIVEKGKVVSALL